MQNKLLFVSAAGLVSLLSCSTDKFETDPCSAVSYLENIRPLIETKCALTGCHVAGFPPGDFTNEEVVRRKASEGKIQLMVFSLNNMPPVNKLTDEEKSLLKCWLHTM